MSAGFIRGADDLIFFQHPETDVDVQGEVLGLPEPDRAGVTGIAKSLLINPKQTIDVRGTWGRVRAITFNNRVWVAYWIATRPRRGSAPTWVCVRILLVAVLAKAPDELPESQVALALERYAQDVQILDQI